jgi:hypothetical protein
LVTGITNAEHPLSILHTAEPLTPFPIGEFMKYRHLPVDRVIRPNFTLIAAVHCDKDGSTVEHCRPMNEVLPRSNNLPICLSELR